ncbi:unnamed protein product [Discosporangium mesarthrocarpum]
MEPPDVVTPRSLMAARVHWPCVFVITAGILTVFFHSVYPGGKGEGLHLSHRVTSPGPISVSPAPLEASSPPSTSIPPLPKETELVHVPDKTYLHKAEGIHLSDETVRFKATAPLPGGLAAEVWNITETRRAAVLERWGWQYNDTLFSGAMKFEDGGEVVINKIVEAIVRQRDFIFSFTGLSHTAGHDNAYEQSYPVLVGGAMSEAWAATGSRLEVRNVAMGHTPTSPYSFCVDAHAGEDADIVSWEMGSGLSFRECGRGTPVLELFVRSAMALPKRPAVLVLNCLPLQDGCSEDTNREKGFDNTLTLLGVCGPKATTPSLLETYGGVGLHYLSVEGLVSSNTCGDLRYSEEALYRTGKLAAKPKHWHQGPLGHMLVAAVLSEHYLALLREAVLRLDKISPGITVQDLQQGLEQGSEREAGLQSVLLEKLGLLTRAGVWGGHRGDGGRGRSLEGPGGNRSWEQVEQQPEIDMHSTNRNSKGEGDGEGAVITAATLPPLPPPVHCRGYYYCEHPRHHCATTFIPISNPRQSLRLMVAGAGPDGVPLPRHTRVDPAMLNTKISTLRARLAEPRSPKKWALVLNEETPAGFVGLGPPYPGGVGRPPIDRKWVLVGGKQAGEITFNIETTSNPRGSGLGLASGLGQAQGKENPTNGSSVGEVGGWGSGAQEGGRVAICYPHFITRADFHNGSQVQFKVDGEEVSVVELPLQGPMGGPGDKVPWCAVLGVQLEPGKHNVSVVPLVDSPLTAVSHLIYPM